MLDKLRFKKELILTYLNGCTVACSHCVTNSAPGLKQRLPLETAKRLMTEAQRAGYAAVNVTGGEPFLAYQDLRQLIRHAKDLRQTISVTSNGFWARSLEKAQEKLLPLREDGLDRLHLSYDQPHHAVGLSVERIENGVQAAKRIGLSVSIWLACFKQDRMMRNIRRRLEKYKVEFRISDMVPLGRAKGLDKDLFAGNKKGSLSEGCGTYGFLVMAPEGGGYACCNAAPEANGDNPLYLGNIFEKPFKRIMEEKDRLVIHELISYFGPKTLYDLLPASIRSQIPTDLHPCAFCLRILNSKDSVDLLLRKIEQGNHQLNRKLALLQLLRKATAK